MSKQDLIAFCDEYIKPHYNSPHEDDYQFIVDALIERDRRARAQEREKIRMWISPDARFSTYGKEYE